MNTQRRKELYSIADKLQELKGKLETLCSEEEQHFDDLPDKELYTDYGGQIYETIGHMQCAIINIERTIDEIHESAS